MITLILTTGTPPAPRPSSPTAHPPITFYPWIPSLTPPPAAQLSIRLTPRCQIYGQIYTRSSPSSTASTRSWTAALRCRAAPTATSISWRGDSLADRRCLARIRAFGFDTSTRALRGYLIWLVAIRAPFAAWWFGREGMGCAWESAACCSLRLRLSCFRCFEWVIGLHESVTQVRFRFSYVAPYFALLGE